jgi:hypothetical protein
MEVDVHDPLANPEQAMSEYGITLNQGSRIRKLPSRPTCSTPRIFPFADYSNITSMCGL